MPKVDCCIMCGAYVPEGRQVCYECEWSYSKNGPHEMTAREFVMVQRRLCNKYNIGTIECTGCPLNGKEVCGKFHLDLALIDAVEQWAKEHPETKHKTYAEVFFEKFPKAWRRDGIPCICRNEVYKGKSCPLGMRARFDPDCAACWNEEMEVNDE